MKNIIIPLIAAMAMLGMAGCEKEKTNTELLTAGPWYVHSITDSLGRVTMHYSQYSPCERDNYFQFEANGSAYQDPGSILCNPQERREGPFGWRFIDSETRIQLDDRGGVPSTFWLEVLSEDTLALKLVGDNNYIFLVHHL